METASSPSYPAARIRAVERELLDLRRELRLYRRVGLAENVKVMQIVVLELEREHCLVALRTGQPLDHIPVAEHVPLSEPAPRFGRRLPAVAVGSRRRERDHHRLRSGFAQWLGRMSCVAGYIALALGLVICALRAALIADPSKVRRAKPESYRTAVSAMRRGRPLPASQSGDVAVPYTGPLF